MGPKHVGAWNEIHNTCAFCLCFYLIDLMYIVYGSVKNYVAIVESERPSEANIVSTLS